MPRKLTMDLIIEALAIESKKRGYCLCIHPMMTIINFEGLRCQWCLQTVTDQSWEPEAKKIRTECLKTAYPWAVKNA